MWSALCSPPRLPDEIFEELHFIPAPLLDASKGISTLILMLLLLLFRPTDRKIYLPPPVTQEIKLVWPYFDSLFTSYEHVTSICIVR